MPFTDFRRSRLGLAACAALLASCGSAPPPPPVAPPAGVAPAGAAPTAATTPRPAGVPPRAAAPAPLPPAPRARNWDDFRRQAALRLVAANPEGTYMGRPPEPLLAIPVLEIELDAAGGVRRMAVLRKPSQAHDTTELAMAAVRRAAPFGSVAHLPGPWKFTEVFLFDDRRRFKPRTLDD